MEAEGEQRMREIKFRVWDENARTMWSDKDLINGRAKYDHIFGCPGLVPLQYTGLKDKNGVEIYEGDICEIPRYIMGREVERLRREVVFNDGQFGAFIESYHFVPLSAYFIPIEKSGRYVPNFGTVYDENEMPVEVVGNIYETPSLWTRS